jgi:small GTP-binding protein
MALFNYATKEITLKIVYYGPGLSGKTTNIQNLHSVLNSENKGKLLSLATESDRTLFFDFLPVQLGKIKEFSIRFQLYTVPGQVRYNATRKVVLKGADAVVFVADSQREMREQNIESFENMRDNLISNNINPDEIPVVLQFNKRDLKNLLTVDELNADLNFNNIYNIIEAEAINGKGVKDTFQLITRLVLKDIARKHKIEIQPAPLQEETKQEEKIVDTQMTGLESFHSDAEVKIIEPSSYAQEEELEIIEPTYELEEEFEETSFSEKTSSEIETALKTGHEIKKDVHKLESREIFEQEPPVIPDAKTIEPVTDVTKLRKEYEIDRDIYRRESSEIIEEEVPEISDSKIKESAADVTKLKTGYESEKNIFRQAFRDIAEKDVPVISDDKIKEAAADFTKLKTGYESEKDTYRQPSREIIEKVVPAISDSKIKEVAADVTKLNAVILDLKGTVASLKEDILEIRNTLNSINANIASGEDKHIKELRKEMRDLHGFLGNISSVLRDLKIKKSWFRL